MQSISPLTKDDFLGVITQPLLKIELFCGEFSPFMDYGKYGSDVYGGGVYGGDWINISTLDGINGDCIQDIALSISSGSVTPKPVAAKWSALIFNKDALFHPSHPTSGYTNVFTMGRKVKLFIGIKADDTNYYYAQVIGVMNKPKFTGKLYDVQISGFDYAQALTDTKLKSPDNYWGSDITKSTVADQYEYDMPSNCKGVYVAYWNGDAIFNENDWTYNASTNKFVFNSDKTIEDGTDNLIIYYFTEQIPENVVADLLVAAGLYETQSDAISDMEYIATGITIDRVWFNAGNSALHAIRLICERCDYRFWFKYDGTPVFKPKLEAKAEGSEDLTLLENQYAEYDCYEEDSEVFNRVVIEGEEQASPVWKQGTEPNKLKGSDSDSDSIEEIGEKTLSIENHLFQSQSVIDSMCSTLLNEYKIPKKYISFNLEFSPIPLELYDTVKLRVRLTSASGVGGKYNEFKYGDGTKYGSNGVLINHRGLVRDIKINRFSTRVILEEVA